MRDMIASKINMRSMPKRAIIMEIECANFGKINAFSRFPMALIMPFCHSVSALEHTFF